MIEYTLVFAAIAFVDALWTIYIKAIQHNAPFRAAMASGAIYALGAYAILAFTESPVYLIPACLGAIVGTGLVVWYHQFKEKEKIIENSIDPDTYHGRAIKIFEKMHAILSRSTYGMNDVVARSRILELLINLMKESEQNEKSRAVRTTK